MIVIELTARELRETDFLILYDRLHSPPLMEEMAFEMDCSSQGSIALHYWSSSDLQKKKSLMVSRDYGIMIL